MTANQVQPEMPDLITHIAEVLSEGGADWVAIDAALGLAQTADEPTTEQYIIALRQRLVPVEQVRELADDFAKMAHVCGTDPANVVWRAAERQLRALLPRKEEMT